MQEVGHFKIENGELVQTPEGADVMLVQTCTPNNSLPRKETGTMCQFTPSAEKTISKVYFSPVPGQEVGEIYIDFMKELVYYRNCRHVACRILSYLTPKDLRSICCVSQIWRKACMMDSSSNEKRLHELDSLKKNFFNLEEENEWQPKEKATFQPKYARGPLGNIENFVEVKRPKEYIQEPFVLSRYNLFREEAKKLLPCESLQPCPRCTSPSRVDPYLKRGLCSREGCAYNFCTKCCCQYHECRPCPILNKPRLPQKDLIGSKSSRRNLKRL